jgi:8-oxo-dGTP pyrophosphatase MutT (NUDIX family)
MTWQTLASRSVYENRWIRVREDDVDGPDGRGIYGVVEVRHPSVFVVALDVHDRVCLVSVDRYATGGRSLELPAGGTDGEEPLDAARRELGEETGFAASAWTRLGGMNALNGIANAPEHVFLARGVRRLRSAAGSQAAEGIQDVVWMPFADVLTLISEGGMSDGESIAAIAFAGIHLGRFR